jgi:3,4-dihydroxy 2-butanone 4-phosphate synthase/GTP cyclohydrolase II
MVEGGARIITSFLKDSLVDQAVITLSPRFLGGLKAVVSPLGGKNASTPALIEAQFEKVGEDFIVYGRLGRA